MRSLARLTLLAALFVIAAPTARAQDARAQVLALADSALAAITRGDVVALTDLMIPEAVMFPTGDANGVPRYVLRTREQQRTTPFGMKITERGWNGEAKVAGNTAMVWLPYDLYRGDTWSHCGVDTFLFVKTASGWKISAMTWSVEQPPVCAKHPQGPPAGAK
jgi:ketosteroid isomerase-like protein